MNYNLGIFIPERCLTILVTKEIADTFVTEWKAWKANVARDENEIFEIHGICDSADRTERTITVPGELIQALDLYKV